MQILITEEDISGKRLIMLKYSPLDKIKPEFKQKLEKFEDLMSQSFQPRRMIEIEQFPDELLENLSDNLKGTARTVNALIKYSILEPIPVMLRKLVHNQMLICINVLKLSPEAEEPFKTDLDKSIIINKDLGLISSTNAKSLKKEVKVLGDSLAHSVYSKVYKQQVFHDMRTIQNTLTAFPGRLKDLLKRPDKIESIKKKIEDQIRKKGAKNKLPKELPTKKEPPVEVIDYELVNEQLDWLLKSNLPLENVISRLDKIKRETKKVYNIEDKSPEYLSKMDTIVTGLYNFVKDKNIEIINLVAHLLVDFVLTPTTFDLVKIKCYDFFLKQYSRKNYDNNVILMMVKFGYFDDKPIGTIRSAVIEKRKQILEIFRTNNMIKKIDRKARHEMYDWFCERIEQETDEHLLAEMNLWLNLL